MTSTKHFNGTEKDYAISLGLAKAGRGRMSLDAKKAVQAAKKNGMTFRIKGAPTATVTVVSKPQKDSEAPVTEEKEVNQFADAFYRYDRDQMFAYKHEGKTYKINGKGACMNCGYSLVGHTCNDPVVLTYHGAQKVSPVAK
jgi:hypothetical protein